MAGCDRVAACCRRYSWPLRAGRAGRMLRPAVGGPSGWWMRGPRGAWRVDWASVERCCGGGAGRGLWGGVDGAGSVGCGCACGRFCACDPGAARQRPGCRQECPGPSDRSTGFSGDRGSAGCHRAVRGRARRGVRSAVLRRGRDFGVGFNRLVVRSGRGRKRRYVAVTFVAGQRTRGALHVRVQRQTGSGMAVAISGPAKRRFALVATMLNGRRVNTRDWVEGLRTPSTTWPLAQRSFLARFGADDGAPLRQNRLMVTAWNTSGRFDGACRCALMLVGGRRWPAPARVGGPRSVGWWCSTAERRVCPTIGGCYTAGRLSARRRGQGPVWWLRTALARVCDRTSRVLIGFG